MDAALFELRKAMNGYILSFPGMNVQPVLCNSLEEIIELVASYLDESLQEEEGVKIL
jgi:hypothetical protein